MATMSGKLKSIVQSMANPNSAPTCEYVAIPLGSSSAAPVIRPGPKLPRTVGDFASSSLRF
jgi:hypothetical protein